MIQAPVEGAQRDGLRGAMEGVARGIVGVAVKPAAGVLELAARGSEALRHATADGSGAGVGSRGRVRPRRAGVCAESPLPRYNLLAASLAEVLELSGACLPSEQVLLYMGVGQHTVVCTLRRVLCLRSSRWAKMWAVAWPQLISVQLVPARALVSLRCRPAPEEPRLAAAAGALGGGGGHQPPSSGAVGASAGSGGGSAGGAANVGGPSGAGAGAGTRPLVHHPPPTPPVGAGGPSGEGAIGYTIACEDETTCRYLYEELQVLLSASREGAPPFSEQPRRRTSGYHH